MKKGEWPNYPEGSATRPTHFTISCRFKCRYATLIPARIVRSAVYAIGHAIAVAITIADVGDAIAIAVTHRRVAIPAAAFVDPAAFAFRPVAGMIVIADALALPMAL